MTVEAISRDVDGGWMIRFNNRFYHVNETWCDEMWRHQFKRGNSPGFNRLRFLVTKGSTDSQAVADAFTDALAQKPSSGTGRSTVTSEFNQWMKEQRT